MQVNIQDLREGEYLVNIDGSIKPMRVVEDTSNTVIYGIIPGFPNKFLSANAIVDFINTKANDL